MSVRQIAKQLGVSHTLLVLWKQGKRSLDPVLEARYHALVTNRAVTTGYKATSVKMAGMSGVRDTMQSVAGVTQSGRVPAFQAGCRGFESRPPLHSFRISSHRVASHRQALWK